MTQETDNTLARLRSDIWNLADAICADLANLHTAPHDHHAARRLTTYARSLTERADQHFDYQTRQTRDQQTP